MPPEHRRKVEAPPRGTSPFGRGLALGRNRQTKASISCGEEMAVNGNGANQKKKNKNHRNGGSKKHPIQPTRARPKGSRPPPALPELEPPEPTPPAAAEAAPQCGKPRAVWSLGLRLNFGREESKKPSNTKNGKQKKRI